MADTFNLFANIDEFSSNDGNDSFLELENSNHDIVELPEDVDSKKRVTKRKQKNTRKTKTKVEKPIDVDDDDDDTTEIATVISPGVGQKTAFKKLTKLKQDLETIATEPTTRKRRALASSTMLREAYQKQRSKRSRAAEIAEIECIDLLPSSSTLRQNIAQDSFEDEDLSLSIKLKWEGTSKIEKIPFSLYKPFNELIAQLSDREKCDAKSFLLMIGSNVIKSDDSPHSIGYTLGKFISVRIVDNPHQYVTEGTTSNENTIEIKIQSLQWKKPILCNIKITDQFKVLAGICSEKLKCRTDKLRFKFDGDILDITSTPEDQDFEGGEVLDIIISD